MVIIYLKQILIGFHRCIRHQEMAKTLNNQQTTGSNNIWLYKTEVAKFIKLLVIKIKALIRVEELMQATTIVTKQLPCNNRQNQEESQK